MLPYFECVAVVTGPGNPQHVAFAKPGSQFTFAGRVSYLDLSRKLIAVDNSSDKLKYDISIEAIAPNILRQIHEGDHVAVVAVFDGSRYDARRIDLPSSPNQNQP